MAEDKRSRMGKGRETGEMVNRYTLPPYDMPLPDEKRYILYNQIGSNSKEDKCIIIFLAKIILYFSI